MSLQEKQANQKKLAIEVAPILFHYKWVAHHIGISEKTIERWRKADKDFDDRLNQARADFISKNMRKARAEFLLQTADRETFGEKKEVEHKFNPARIILEHYGITSIEDFTDDEQDQGSQNGSPKKTT